MYTRSDASYDTAKLPLYAGAFIGRRGEIARVRQALTVPGSLVTLRGPGGVGKTRTAVEVAREEAQAGRAVVFCDLASAHDAPDVAASVRRALGEATERRTRGIARAVAQLGDAPRVVLDNCEHVMDATAALIRELRDAGASVLATSRRVLGVAGEVVLALEPFATPAADATLADLARNDGVCMLLERARTVTGLALHGEDDWLAAARVVRRVEGLPLAIELAAGRLTVFSLGELDARLAQAPATVLRAPVRGRTDRHGTLESAVEWSWRLLTVSQRIALAEASVFARAFTMDDAAAVLTPEAGARPGETLRALAALSLLREHPCDATDAPRFELYEAVRRYAAEPRATTAATVEHAMARHAALFAARADAAGDDATTLAAAHDELVRVLERCEAGGLDNSAPVAVRVARGLAALHAAHGVEDARVAVLERATALARRAGDEAACTALAGVLRGGDHTSASGVWEIDPDGLWFRPPTAGEVSVRHRLMLTRLLSVLAQRRASRPGEAMSTRELIAHVWSGARLVGDSGGNRLRVAVATLRRMGLEPLLVHRRDGYLLDERAVVRIVSAPSAAA